MTEYVTTNIRLPRTMYKELKRLAVEEEKSVAQVIREGLVEYLVSTKTPEAVSKDAAGDDPVYRIAELTNPEDVVEGDRPLDTSARHDYYLYGVDLDDSSHKDSYHG